MPPARQVRRWGCCCMGLAHSRCAASVCCAHWVLQWRRGGWEPETGPGGTGGLRHVGRNGAVLCLWRRRDGAGALQCGRCPAGCSHRVLSAAVRARKAGCRDASGRGCGSSGAGQCTAVAAAAGASLPARHWSCTCAAKAQVKGGPCRRQRGAGGQPCAPQTRPSALRRRALPVPRRQQPCWHPDGGWKRPRPTRAAA